MSGDALGDTGCSDKSPVASWLIEVFTHAYPCRINYLSNTEYEVRSIQALSNGLLAPAKKKDSIGPRQRQ